MTFGAEGSPVVMTSTSRPFNIYTDIILSVYTTGLARLGGEDIVVAVENSGTIGLTVQWNKYRPLSQGSTAKKTKGCEDDWREIKRSSALRRDACLLFSCCEADSEKVRSLDGARKV